MKKTDNEYIFGANILENLTTGMYKDSRVIYREYIQNACDSIDKAVECGLISSKSKGRILIEVSDEKRTISIEDNAFGIPKAKFRETLANIADSDKKIGEDKGFRGIGRLCGLAYCKELIFSSKASGEDVISVMHCDAQKMRELINKSENGEKVSASEVLDQIYSFEEKLDKDSQNHWFKVELIDINEENTDLLDFALVKDYLSFVAPVPYVNSFIYREEIYKHANELKQSIDEYDIRINGEHIFKRYSTRFKVRNGDDEVLDVKFKDLYDDNGELIAWLWYGVSQFKGVIDKNCKMRGLRLRKENIQIGDEDALLKLFKEERGTHYYVGEVFAVAKDLIPNSQRDYFNENPMRIVFEKQIKSYFKDTLTKIYYDASRMNSSYKAIDNYDQKLDNHKEKEKNGKYIDNSHRDQAQAQVNDAYKKAQDAQKKIEKQKQDTNGEAASVLNFIITQKENERKDKGQKVSTAKLKNPKVESAVTTTKTLHRTDKLSRCNNRERKLISKIYNIIVDTVDEQTAEKIIQRIEDEFK